ncbi:hypothetical protein QFC21_002426 [Naganishia friedmannii]|uniref:Uncharacterized protein n=1 Tax=Naganishia friedmannii TaxID=89922 RepID=A0ACC2VXQ3_9TREE|nr:hypothetical protein QFC21_002426 [Naganishia friedmannii]
MASVKTAPFGTWKSPLESETVYQKSAAITGVLVDGETGEVFHTESRPSEAGRSVLLDTLLPRTQPFASSGPIKTDPQPVVPSTSNVRTRVHEYGEGAAKVHAGFAYWSEFKDGRIYRRALAEGGGGGGGVVLDDHVEALTPVSDVYRYADFDLHPTSKDLLVCIREDHTDDEPSRVKNSLVLINVTSKDIHEIRPARADGFYAFPRFGGKDGSKIAWIEWYHPDMPWEGTELYYSHFSLPEKNKPITPLEPIKIAGEHLNVSINDVKWDPTTTTTTTNGGNPDKLYYLSDQTGFVNLWSVDLGEPSGNVKPDIAMYPLAHDLSEPLWTLNPSWYAIMSSKDALIAPNIDGVRSLAHLDLQRKRVSPITTEYRDITHLRRIDDTHAVFLAGKYDEPRKIVCVTLGARGGDATFQEVEVSTTMRGGPKLDHAYISKGELITLTVQFPPPSSPPDDDVRGKNVDLHVTLYPPTNPEYQAPAGESPPTVVQVHGGPTSRSSPVFNILYQYFTTRGFAVLDVDYGGSSGYGREYQDRLKGRWGEVDVRDTIQAVVELGKMGKIDAERVAIMGGSAGGYTALACLTDSKVFSAGISLYGISDMKLLAGDTHKFEVPEIYEKRSPITKAGNITAELLMLQGLDDKVVPPGQARTLVKKIEDAGGHVEAVFYEARKFER